MIDCRARLDAHGPISPWVISVAPPRPRETHMRTSRFLRRRILLLVLFIGGGLSLIGCGDESRTSGTMVQVSEEAKVHMKSKIDSYKGGPPKSKAKAIAKK